MVIFAYDVSMCEFKTMLETISEEKGNPCKKNRNHGKVFNIAKELLLFSR